MKTDVLHNLLPVDGEMYYIPSFIDDRSSAVIFSQLRNEIAWENKLITIFGKQHPEPRLTAWYGDPGATYAYSGINLAPKCWNHVLQELKRKVEIFSGTDFNSVLLNYYRNGRDSMGWHRDNEKELGKRPVIASLSFGATRRFVVRRYREKSIKIELAASSGSLILMRGDMQTYWEHSIPKQLKESDGRINLTFRKIMKA